MVSQFVSSHHVNLLNDLDFIFPEGTHAIGRLDKNSEGLLLLTTNKKITRLLFQGTKPHSRTYLVQVNGSITDESIEKLRNGVSFIICNGMEYISKSCKVKRAEPYPDNRIGSDKIYHSSTWISIEICEGKYHQVRKMVKAVGHKCLRLIRISIEDIELNNLLPGEVYEMEEALFFKKLKL